MSKLSSLSSAHAQKNSKLPYRTGRTSSQARISIDQNIEQSLIQISKYRFSLVIAGLTKMLQRVNEIVRCSSTPSIQSIRIELISSSSQYQPPQFRHDSERLGYDSLVIILQTLSNILFQYPKDSARYEEAMNVKLLLREICQFMGEFL